MHLETPWGRLAPEDPVSILRVTRAQLQSYLANGSTPNPDATRADIVGYDRILASAHPSENARAFLDAKRADRMAGKRTSNLDLITRLRIMGVWR